MYVVYVLEPRCYQQECKEYDDVPLRVGKHEIGDGQGAKSSVDQHKDVPNPKVFECSSEHFISHHYSFTPVAS